jgi:chemotaxis protein CheY-P-specific phosphatase CheC
MENSVLQKYISAIMNKGFEKAAKSFSHMVGGALSFAHSSTTLIAEEQDFTYVSGEKGELMVLSTNMIGDLSGRSYLILSEQERREICQAASPTRPLDEKLQEALLLEIDNIVSASVIGQLADDLGIEVYGDVPQLQYVKAERIRQFLSSSISQESHVGMLLCNTTFLLGTHDHIHPQFIWKLSTKVFHMIQQQAIL